MYKVLLLTFVIIALVALGASIGLIFKKKPLQGSCGGLTALGFEKACSCKEPCDQAREKDYTLETAKNTSNSNQSFENSSEASSYVEERSGEGTFKVNRK